MTLSLSSRYWISRMNSIQVLSIFLNLTTSDGADRLLSKFAYTWGYDQPIGPPSDLNIAMILGRTRFIEEILRRTAWGIDFDRLETEQDAKQEPASKLEPPRYYVGLRIRGKYRRDWAKAAAPSQDSPHHSSKVPIGLLAAYCGNPQTIEWFFSRGPEKAIGDFITSHDGDRRAVLLGKAHWRDTLPEWLGVKFSASHTNAMHAAIIGRSQQGINAVFHEFTDKGIDAAAVLDSTQDEPKHNTLLTSARVVSNFQYVYEVYTKHGSDPSVSDEFGYNVLHLFAYRAAHRESSQQRSALQFCFDKLSQEQKAKMLSARIVKLLHTPIALAVLAKRLDIVKLLADHGKEQLHLRDRDGNLPIHVAASKGLAKIARMLIDADPTTLLVENTGGALPVEIAEQKYLLTRTQSESLVDVTKTITSID